MQENDMADNRIDHEVYSIRHEDFVQYRFSAANSIHKKGFFEMPLQVLPSHYYTEEYNPKGRFCSYWHQIDEVRKAKPKNVLLIGIGDNVVTEYLRKAEVQVKTLDFDKNLEPDICEDILKTSLHDASFDMVVCCEVLEHLPFESFSTALHEIYRIASKTVVLSLPDITRCYKFNVQLPKLGEIRKLLSLPRFYPPIRTTTPEHFWEIGIKDFSTQRIISYINAAGFIVSNEYRVFESGYFHFFVLLKK